MEHYAEAEPLFEQNLKIFEAFFSSNHRNIVASLNNLVLLYQKTERYADSERLCLRSLKIRKKAMDPYHPDFLDSLNNLASLYEVIGRYADAERLYLDSLATLKEALGPDHSDMGNLQKMLNGIMKRLATLICPTLAVFVFSATGGVSADLQNGLNAYKNGDYAMACVNGNLLLNRGMQKPNLSGSDARI